MHTDSLGLYRSLWLDSLFGWKLLDASGVGVFRKLGKLPPLAPRHFLSSFTTAERVDKSSALGSRASSISRLDRDEPERTSRGTLRTGGKGVRFLPFKLETAELIFSSNDKSSSTCSS